MKDCIFLLADLDMESTFRGFLTRNNFHLALQVRLFEFECIRAPTKDPGVYNQAHELLRSYQRSHRYAVVVLDEAWDGSPGAEAIRQYIHDNLIRSGWSEDRIAIIVIRP